MRYLAVLGNLAVGVILLMNTFMNPPSSLSLVLLTVIVFFLLAINSYYVLKPTDYPAFISTFIKRCNVDQEIKLIEAQNKLKDYQKKSF